MGVDAVGTGLKVYLVFPDLGGAKAEALCRLARGGLLVDVLVSYSIFLFKPVTRRHLERLRAGSCLGSVMLDSGAYHVAFRGLSLDPENYAVGASSLRGHVDLVVGPDVPRRPRESLERLRRFSASYPDSFLPTLQSESLDPEGYIESLEALESSGLLARAPRVDGGRPLLGVGGLVGAPVRAVARVVEAISDSCDCLLHLFGANVRMVRGLARRGLLDRVYSIDTSGWLSEIRWRRRTLYRARSTLEANVKAIQGYIEKVRVAAGR